jgi:exopolysaccharide biosynthesis polyprenyl glycosylphosphotransferase
MNRRRFVLWGFVSADLSVLTAALYVAARWVSTPEAPLAAADVLHLRLQVKDIAVAVLTLSGWVLSLRYFGLYRPRHLSFMKFRHYHFKDLLKATAVGTLLLVGGAFLSELRYVTVEFVSVFWAAVTLGTLLVREGLIQLLRQMRLHGRNLRHLLIVGTNPRAQAFARRVQQQPELGYHLRGFVDDDWAGGHGVMCEPGVVASRHSIAEYLRDHVVDEVLIALPMATLYREATKIVRTCEDHGVVVHFVPGLDFLNRGSSRATFDTLNEEPVITVLPPPMSGWQLSAKRAIDLIGAAALILLLAPALAFIALAIKLTSKGPVLFVQDRVGLNKRTFRMLKFRTMVNNAEGSQKTLEHINEASGPVFKITRDPRVTPLGAFLRRTSLDELMQLFNVLRGDMSLVGPRPLPLRDYEGFDQDWHRRRFSVRPGITCLWQVCGRSSISFDKWMELDMEYINRWSLWLDVKILAQTVPAVLARRGAV